MANLPSGQFNPEDYQDMRDFTPVPPGKTPRQAGRC